MENENVNRLGCFVAFMIVSNSTTLMPFSWGVAYYAVLLGSLFFLLFCSGQKVCVIMLCLYLVAGLSIALNNVPEVFKPWERYGTFLMLTMVVSPSLMGRLPSSFKINLFSSTLVLLAVLTGISFIMLLLGKGYDAFNGWFQGVMCHSMTMGPVAAISVLFSLYQLQYKQRHKWRKYAYFFCIAGGFLCLLQSGSRAALVAGIMSSFAFFMFRNVSSAKRLIHTFAKIGFLVLITVPLWGPYTDKIVQKNRGESSSLDTSSRTEHWNQRIDEWQSSPLYGIGFASVDIQAERGSNFSKSSGKVETGSSWLSVLSMTGILGGICILTIFSVAAFRCLKLLQSSASLGAFLLALMIFFIFHMTAEGYIFAGGNFLNTQLWLLLGTIASVTQYPQYAELLERKLQFS